MPHIPQKYLVNMLKRALALLACRFSDERSRRALSSEGSIKEARERVPSICMIFPYVTCECTREYQRVFASRVRNTRIHAINLRKSSGTLFAHFCKITVHVQGSRSLNSWSYRPIPARCILRFKRREAYLGHLSQRLIFRLTFVSD